jgi:hypothetical protein
MATVSEGLFIENLVWSDVEYSLAGFVENFQLPQIVRVESGYFGGNDSTSLSSGQVVRLHCVRKIKKFACHADRKGVALPYAYPVKCVVENREFSNISALQLSIMSDQVKYILTLGDYHNSKSPNSNSFQEGAILEITGVDTKGKSIQCRDVSTTKKIKFHFDCTALFCPLRDCNQYTLAEVVEKFEIPVKVRFLRQSSEATIDPNLPSFVSNLQEVISILDVIEQTVVVMTTLGENSKDGCLEITKDTPVYVRVAQEFLENEVIYVRMVKPLDRLFKSSSGDYENVASVTTRYDYDVNNEDSQFRCRAFAYQRPPAARFQKFESSGLKPISKANTASIRSLENAQPTQDRHKSSDEEPAYLETKDLWPMIKPRKSDSEINYNRSDTQKGDKTAQPAHDEELIYVEVTDPKPVKTLRKSCSEINYTGSNAQTGCIPNRTGNKKTRPVPAKGVRTLQKSESDITCNRTGNKGLIPSQTEDGKALPDTSNPKPLFVSKEDLLNKIEKRKMHRKENKNDQGEADTPRTTRNIPEKKLPSKVLSTPKNDKLNELASLQTKRLNNDHQNSADEIYYEPTTVRNSDSVLSMSPDCFLSSSPVKTSTLPKNLSGLSVNDVTTILCVLDLERYAGIFEEELIDGAMLESMDEEILKSIGMNPFHVKRMIRFINGWRPNIR